MRKKYMRFGQIPLNEKSINFIKMPLSDSEDFTWEMNAFGYDEAVQNVKDEYFENGVSVFEIDEDENALLTNDKLQSSYDFRKNRYDICYIVEGEQIGTGTDGEPLIVNVKIIREK